MVPSAPIGLAPCVHRDGVVTARQPLPVRVTPLVGRVHELTELFGVLERDRMVTLTGSGGCGKTRLGLELVHRVGDRFPGGIAWVELAACADAEGVVGEVGAVLDVLEMAGEDVLDGVVRALRDRAPSLVVLDNAEHVLAAAAEVAATITARVEQVRVVCTSREPLGVPGEVVWRVPSLRVPPTDGAAPLEPRELLAYEAVQLFAECARRARRGFTVNAANAAAIAQICVRLDGVPLAIELAAARVRTMPPERIAAQLDDRFRLLAGGPRTLLARQQTLQASVAWSEGLLDDGERRVFRRLGVFAGGFTVDAAETVAAAFGDVDPYDVAETVGRLVDKSLVQLNEDTDRCSLLDTIRSYALQRLLDEGELAPARDAHAAWCATWLAGDGGVHDGDDVNSWWASRLRIIGRIDPEWPNCAAALDWVPPGSERSLQLVTGLGDYWALRQRANDSARYGMPALRSADADEPAWLEAVVALQAVRTNAADRHYAVLREEALTLAADRGDRRAELRLTLGHHIGMVMLLGPRDEILADLDHIRDEALVLGEWYTAWNAVQGPAVMLVTGGSAVEAEARVRGLTSARASMIRALAALARGDLNASRDHAAEAATMVDAPLGAAMDRTLIAFHSADTALATADPTVLVPLRLHETSTAALPRPFVSAFALARGVGQLLDGRLDDARATFVAAPPDLFTSWRSVCYLAPIELALGDVAAAEASARRLLEVTATVSAPMYETTAELVLAECAMADDGTRALEHAHRALAAAAAADLGLATVDALEAIGAVLTGTGRRREAARLLGAAEAARATMTYRFRHAHRAAYVDRARRAVDGDEGWAEGHELTLGDAVALAQRMRGDRLRPLAGWDSLTPTERRVVEQVVAGLTNPEIADAMLMSRATVKTHLVHVYAKLGVRTRAELAALAARRGDT